jgi:hypothetical protein
MPNFKFFPRIYPQPPPPLKREGRRLRERKMRRKGKKEKEKEGKGPRGHWIPATKFCNASSLLLCQLRADARRRSKKLNILFMEMSRIFKCVT